MAPRCLYLCVNIPDKIQIDLEHQGQVVKHFECYAGQFGKTEYLSADLFGKKNTAKRKEVQEKHDQQAKAYMEAFMVSVNKKFQEKGGGVSG